eukprot:11469694-Alexandrium_andersonii.AAC.1
MPSQQWRLCTVAAPGPMKHTRPASDLRFDSPTIRGAVFQITLRMRFDSLARETTKRGESQLHADTCIAHSRSEGPCYFPLDGLACRSPCCCTDTGSWC